MTSALYPGRFNPVTNGHLDIVSRAASLFTDVIVAVYEREPVDGFTVAERVALLRAVTQDLANVRVDSFEGLLVSYARRIGATVLVRGIRAMTDFEGEFDMAMMNKKMAPEIESVYLMTSLEHQFISASRIREIAALGYPVDDLVPAPVAAALAEKFGGPVQQ